MENPVEITRVEPSRVMLGVPQGSLELEGKNFTPQSSVLFDGIAVTATLENAEMQVQIPDSAWNLAKSHTLEVSDPANGKSNVAQYEVYAAQPGPRTFAGQLTQYLTQSLPVNALVPDMNGDGRADLVSLGPQDPNTFQSLPQLMLGQADGTFSPPVSLGTLNLAFSPTVVLAGDFNADGVTDCLVFGSLNNTFSSFYQLLLNDGTGHFTSSGSGSVPSPNQTSVVVGDFNHDGKLDFAYPTSSTGQPFSFFYGNGDGTFSNPVPVGLSLNSVTITAKAADLNGDGYTDLVYLAGFSSGAPNQIRMLLSASNGTYTDTAISGLPSPTFGFVVADFNNDHIPDIFATSQNTLGLTYAGAGDGSFHAVGTPVVAADGFFVTLPMVAGDFDGDGNVDVATRTDTFGGDQLDLLWGDGTGSFVRQPLASDHSFTLQVGDVNGDGVADIFQGAGSGFAYPSVALGKKNSRSLSSAQIIAPRVVTYLSAGNFFGDGLTDLLVGGSDDNGMSGVPGAIYRSQPNGAFAIKANGPGYATVAVDLNADGTSDLVGFATTGMFVWQSDGSGSFQLVNQMTLPYSVQQFYFRDMDGDGHIDVVLPGVILYGQGNFQFDAVPIQFYQNFAVGDFDGDGIPDIATASGVLFGIGNRGFTSPTGSTFMSTSSGPFLTQVVADINHDGKDDLLIGDSAILGIFTSNGQGFVHDQSLFVNGYAVTISSVCVADFNGDNLPDIAVGIIGGDDVTLFTNDGAGRYQVTTYAIGIYAIDSVAADVNHDGNPDIAFASYASPRVVTVLLHN